MINWKALLKNNQMITDNFTANRDNIVKVYITVRDYIYKETTLRRFARKHEGKSITFIKTEDKDYIYHVKDTTKLLIQEARTRNIITGADERIGIKLTIDGKVIYFDDINKTVKEENIESR